MINNSHALVFTWISIPLCKTCLIGVGWVDFGMLILLQAIKSRGLHTQCSGHLINQQTILYQTHVDYYSAATFK